MKATAREITTNAFKPVELNLVFDTIGELEEFYAIFNSPNITRHLDNLDNCVIRNAITDVIQINSNNRTHKLMRDIAKK